MHLVDDQVGEIAVVRVEEKRIDAARAPAFKDAMNAKIEAGAKRIVLDLGSVDFVDSSGLGAVVSFLKRLGSSGALAIARPTSSVRRLFELTRMDRVIPLDDTVEGAVKRIS